MKEHEVLSSINPSEVEKLMARAEGGQLRAEDGPLIGRLLRLVLMLARLLDRKNASLARLRRLLFGPRSEKRSPPPAAASAERPAGAEKDEPVPNDRPKPTLWSRSSRWLHQPHRSTPPRRFTPYRTMLPGGLASSRMFAASAQS